MSSAEPQHEAEEGGQEQYEPPTQLFQSCDAESIPDDHSVVSMDTGEQVEEEESDTRDSGSSFQRRKEQGIPTLILEGIRREEKRARKEKSLHQRKLRNLFFWDFAGQVSE